MNLIKKNWIWINSIILFTKRRETVWRIFYFRNKIINATTIVLSYPRFKNKWFKYMKLYLHKRIIDEKNLREK